jgi:hypothetical protein
VQELSDRDRSIAAYSASVRGFHTFFGTVILILVLLHLFVLLPFVEVRTAAPTLRSAIERTQAEAAANAEAQKGLAASASGLVAFKRALEVSPAQVAGQIAGLVARSQNGGTPFDYRKATVRVPREPGLPPASPSGGGGASAAAPGGSAVPAAGQPAGDEVVPIADAVRRVFGKQTEALSVALDGALGPLRTLHAPPSEVADAIKIAEEGIGRNVLALNDLLREAFEGDPPFWQRLSAPGATFASVSARGASWHAGTGDAVRALEERLASAATHAKSREQVLTQRVQALDGQQAQARERLAAFATRMAWVPVGLELWTRLYPIVAGALALTVLVRLQRIMLLRQALGDRHLDELAPSWIIGPPGTPGRWWALTLVSIPLLLSAHAAFAALRDAALFVNPVGDRDVASMVSYGAVYAAMVAAGLMQLRAMLSGATSRNDARSGRGAL